MSGKSLIDQIRHYQRDIEKCPENSERMIRCIQRLYVLPILVQHLQETGVGRSVNSLRKYNGAVGDAAKALVAKWKAMVAAEESSDGEQIHEQSHSEPEEQISSPPPPPIPQPQTDKHSKSSKEKEKVNKHDHHSNNNSGNQENHKKHESSSRHRHHHSERNKSSHHSTSSSVKKSSTSHESSKNSSGKNSSSEKRKHSSSSNDRHKQLSTSNDKYKHNRHSSSKETNRKHKSSEDERSPCRKKRRKHSPIPEKKVKKIVEKTPEQSSNSEAEEEEEEGEDDVEKANQSDAGSTASSSDERIEQNNKSDYEIQSDNSDNEIVQEVEELEEEEEDDNDEIDEEEEENDVIVEESASDSDDDSDHRHRSKHHNSHYKHKSSHSSKEKVKEHSSKHKEKSTNSSHNSHKSSNHSSSNSNKKSSSENLKKLIKENEMKIKKEKSSHKPAKVKIERNEDGSVDNASGASFADALLGMDMPAPKKKKKPNSSSKNDSSPPQKSSSSSSKPKPSSPSSSSKPKPSSPTSSSSSPVHHHSSSSSKKSKSSSSSKPADVFKEPDLLSKNIKLEALDIDVAGSLPEIDLNYKPLPHIPEHSLRRNNKTMTEEETMFSIMTTKNQRTKVFSGAKVGCYVTVPSLYSLCIQILYENIEGMEYTGGVPYDLLKPLLEKLNADQLYVLEHFNPYLIEDTNTLWHFHCRKYFRSEIRNDMESWRDLYLRCMDEREKKLKELTANITQSMAKSTPVRTAKLAYVDHAAKPPRNVARAQAKFGTGKPTSSSSSSSSSSSQISGINQNKQQIVSKAMIGGHTPGLTVKDSVPAPPKEGGATSYRSTPPAFMKKKKAPLMAKALQLIKGNRFKR